MKHLGLDSRSSLLFGLASLALACDPAGPGAAGNLSLDPSVDASSFTTLEVRAYADSSGKFDPEKVGAGESLELALKDITFPYHYDVSQGVGTTEEQHWRMTAWLAVAAGSQRPAASDPQCSVAFDIAECSGQFDGYCGTTNDVHCTLK